MTLEEKLAKLDELKSQLDSLKETEKLLKADVDQEILEKYGYTLGTNTVEVGDYKLKIVQRESYDFSKDFALADRQQFLEELEKYAPEYLNESLIGVKFQLNKKLFDAMPDEIRVYMQTKYLMFSLKNSFTWAKK